MEEEKRRGRTERIKVTCRGGGAGGGGGVEKVKIGGDERKGGREGGKESRQRKREGNQVAIR